MCRSVDDFGDMALQPGFDPWASVNFHGRVKIHANLAKTYKNKRLSAGIGTKAEVTGSPESPGKLLPQRKYSFWFLASVVLTCWEKG